MQNRFIGDTIPFLGTKNIQADVYGHLYNILLVPLTNIRRSLKPKRHVYKPTVCDYKVTCNVTKITVREVLFSLFRQLLYHLGAQILFCVHTKSEWHRSTLELVFRSQTASESAFNSWRNKVCPIVVLDILHYVYHHHQILLSVLKVGDPSFFCPTFCIANRLAQRSVYPFYRIYPISRLHLRINFL